MATSLFDFPASQINLSWMGLSHLQASETTNILCPVTLVEDGSCQPSISQERLLHLGFWGWHHFTHSSQRCAKPIGAKVNRDRSQAVGRGRGWDERRWEPQGSTARGSGWVTAGGGADGREKEATLLQAPDCHRSWPCPSEPSGRRGGASTMDTFCSH